MTPEQLAALPEAVERLREAITPPLPGQTILGIELDRPGIADLRLVLEGLDLSKWTDSFMAANQALLDRHSAVCAQRDELASQVKELQKQLAAALAKEKP